MKQHDAIPPVKPSSDDHVEVGRVLDILRSGKWLILVASLLAGVLGLLYALLATPVYQADALVQVEPERMGMLGGDTPLGFQEESNVEAEIHLFQSRMVLGRAVEERNLEVVVEPHYFPVIGGFAARQAGNPGPAQPLLGASRFAWGGEQVEVPQFLVPDELLGHQFTLRAGQEGGSYTLMDDAGQAVLEGVVGSAAGSGDGRIQIFVRSLLARPGTEFLVTRQSRQAAVNALRRDLSVNEAGRGSAILTLSLEGQNPAQTELTLNAVANAFVRQNVERRSQEAEQRIRFLDEQLPEMRRDLEQAEERFNAFRQENEAFDLSAEGDNLLTQVVEVERQLAEMELQRSELAQNYASQHPRMVALNQQVQQLRDLRDELEGRIRQLPDSQQALLRLQREVEVGSEIYTAMLNQAQELRVMHAGAVGNVRIVDEAVAGGAPVSPRQGLVVGAAGTLGLVLGIGGVFVRHLLRRGISDPTELENHFDTSCYAVVPQSKRFDRLQRRAARQGLPPPILARELPDDMAVESLRSLRTSLHFALMHQQRKTVAITGPGPGVGKTFLSVNLAYLLAEAGKRVLVMDADMRRGHMHDQFNVSRDPGLSDIIAGKVRWQDAMHPVEQTSLSFMSTGTVPPNPSELLMSSTFDTLLEDLEQSFDLVVLDTVPVLAATDGLLVASRAGAVFMTVRAGLNRLPEVEQAMKRFRHDGVGISGFIFNGLPRTSEQGGYGGYYHYQYDYRRQ